MTAATLSLAHLALATLAHLILATLAHLALAALAHLALAALAHLILAALAILATLTSYHGLFAHRREREAWNLHQRGNLRRVGGRHLSLLADRNHASDLRPEYAHQVVKYEPCPGVLAGAYRCHPRVLHQGR